MPSEEERLQASAEAATQAISQKLVGRTVVGARATMLTEKLVDCYVLLLDDGSSIQFKVDFTDYEAHLTVSGS